MEESEKNQSGKVTPAISCSQSDKQKTEYNYIPKPLSYQDKGQISYQEHSTSHTRRMNVRKIKETIEKWSQRQIVLRLHARKSLHYYMLKFFYKNMTANF